MIWAWMLLSMVIDPVRCSNLAVVSAGILIGFAATCDYFGGSHWLAGLLFRLFSLCAEQD